MFKCPKCGKTQRFNRTYSAWVVIDEYGEMIGDGDVELQDAVHHCDMQCIECGYVQIEDDFIRAAGGRP